MSLPIEDILPSDDEDVIAQTIKDYFLDKHGFDTAYWEGFVTQWLDTGEFDALELAENIAERLRARGR